MAFKVTAAELAEWERKGLVRRDPPHAVPYAEQRAAPPRTSKLVTPPPGLVNGVELVLPIRVMGMSNSGGSGNHWSHRYKAFKAQASALELALSGVKLPSLPVSAYWTKLGGQKMDGDNLAGAFKGLRDALAARYGVDDGGTGIQWLYEQDPAGPHGVRLLVTRAETLPPGSERAG